MSQSHRLFIPLLALMLMVVLRAGIVAAQDATEADRGPRFLWRASPAAEPVPISLNATASLRRRVTLKKANATVAELLGALERQTGVTFIYSTDAIGSSRRI